MRVLNIHGVGDVRLDPREPPKAGDNDVVVRIKACGICGSDLSYIKNGGINRQEGGVTPIGHEAAGEVAAVGPGVRDVAVGQRVIINPMQTSTFIGSGGPEGAFTEQVLVGDIQPGITLLPIPEGLPYEVAALAEPLAVALHGVNRTEAKPGDKVAVFGCGPIGLGMVLWLADRGITDVVALNPATEDVRARLGEIHGEVPTLLRGLAVGTDVFMDAAGAPNLINDIVRMGKWHARLVVTAAYMKPQQLDMGSLLVNEMSITTAIGYPTEMNDVVAALPRIKDKAASLISHRYGFDDVIQALDVAGTPQSAKVMIKFEGADA
jgi:(R,R)-butanediol dehydrogenase/meso-butanediol dehydrogenase/diacetyl reductase